MPSCQIYLIRHAESQPNLQTSNPLWELSARGRQQAQQLAELLACLSVAAVYSSPFTRSLLTLQPYAEAAQLPIGVEDDLRESSLVPAYRRDFSSIERKAWSYQSFALPGCESARQARERFRRVLAKIGAAHPQQSVVVGTHGIVLGFFLHGLQASFHYEQAKAITNPDLFHVEWNDGVFTWQHDSPLRAQLTSFSSHR